jgi:putative ATP-dependent endonuclease of OLD family
MIPHVPALDATVANSGGLLTYERASQTLTVAGKLEEALYRNLLTCFGNNADRAMIHGVLRQLRDRSLLFIPDEELRALETFARRVRGEIFFAARWMIVEGQAEYLLLHGLGQGLGYDLDEHGVSVIDAQNNGSPDTFAAVARALGIPWCAVFDGDDAGRSYVTKIAARDFEAAFVAARCKTLPAGNLEQQLLTDGLEPDLRQVLQAIGQVDALTMDQPALERCLRAHKTRYAAELAHRIAADPSMALRMPQALRDAVMSLRGLA